ncbi:hypothetical protein QYM36_004189 [Artemia franciscana]|uniref:Uncharacterized protein n=1 Tax=Artemia franciscana TaxID=6661 RepID=A0AA88LG04_ARTSF|nr:hypothetical protein QYM36_004189 [Artemia franciscana]
MFQLEATCIQRHRLDWKLQKEGQADSKNFQVESDEKVAFSDSEDEEKEKSVFPGTVVRLNESDNINEIEHQIKGVGNNDDQVIISGQLLGERKKSAVEIKATSQKGLEEDNLNKEGSSKRRQHGKMKKMKEKYGYQVEDERVLQIQLLQPFGTKQEKKRVERRTNLKFSLKGNLSASK